MVWRGGMAGHGGALAAAAPSTVGALLRQACQRCGPHPTPPLPHPNPPSPQPEPERAAELAALAALAQARARAKKDCLPCRVADGLFLGGAGAARNLKALRKRGITHVVNASPSVPCHFRDNPEGAFEYLALPLFDDPDAGGCCGCGWGWLGALGRVLAAGGKAHAVAEQQALPCWDSLQRLRPASCAPQHGRSLQPTEGP